MIRKLLYNFKKKKNTEEIYSNSIGKANVSIDYISNMYYICNKLNMSKDDIEKNTYIIFRAEDVLLENEIDLIFTNVDIIKTSIPKEILLIATIEKWKLLREEYTNNYSINPSNILLSIFSLIDNIDNCSIINSNNINIINDAAGFDKSLLVDFYVRGDYKMIGVIHNDIDWRVDTSYDFIKLIKKDNKTKFYSIYSNVKSVYIELSKVECEKATDVEMEVMVALSNVINIKNNYEGNIKDNDRYYKDIDEVIN